MDPSASVCSAVDFAAGRIPTTHHSFPQQGACFKETLSNGEDLPRMSRRLLS
jgi:hypothetical protein